MSKTEQAALREQRLAAKLRENLQRRKAQGRARSDADKQARSGQTTPDPGAVNKP